MRMLPATCATIKVELHRRLSSHAVRQLVPRRFHSQLPWSDLASGETATLILKHKRKEIVASATVQELLASVGDLEERFRIVVAANLTRDAAELLAANGFLVPRNTHPASTNHSTAFSQRVHYSRTDQPKGRDIADWTTANKLLGYLDPVRRHFAIFDLPNGSYVQCLGGKKALTVEARVYGPGGRFTHWVFGKGLLCGLQTQVGSSAGVVTVDRTQVLQIRDARLIIRQFLETNTFPAQYHKQDVTERFVEEDTRS